MNESFTKKTTFKNTKDVIQQASVSPYHFGDLYPNKKKPIGVVVIETPLTIMSFDERRCRIDELIDNFDPKMTKFAKHVGWYIPDIEEMRVVIENIDFFNFIMDSVPSRQEEYENLPWDDEDFFLPSYDRIPNPYKIEKIKEYADYNTRSVYHFNEEDPTRLTYYQTISTRPNRFCETDICNWQSSKNNFTRIFGKVNHITTESEETNESFTSSIKKSDRKTIQKEADVILRNRFFETFDDDKMVEYLLRKKDFDIKKFERGKGSFGNEPSEEDSLYCNVSFFPDEMKDYEGQRLLLRDLIRSLMHDSEELRMMILKKSPNFTGIYFRMDYFPDDEEEKYYYLRLVLKNSIEYYDNFIYWEDMSANSKRLTIDFLTVAKTMYSLE